MLEKKARNYAKQFELKTKEDWKKAAKDGKNPKKTYQPIHGKYIQKRRKKMKIIYHII